MTPVELILMGILVSIIGHALVVLYRSPKELFAAIEEKIDTIQDNHTTLDRMINRHDEVVKNLGASIDRLTNRLDRLDQFITSSKPHVRRGA